MNCVRTIVCFLIMIGSFLLLNGVSPASSQASEHTHIVEGRIINGTAGVSSPAGLEVVFHQVSVTRSKEFRTTTDLDGSFRFVDVIFDPESSHGVSVLYQGALYAEAVDLSQMATQFISLMVYEAIDQENLLTVPSASVLFARVDKLSHTLWVLEIVKISNDTDHTYVPGAEPMKLLRFGLPREFQGLQVDTGLLGADVIEVDRGFALTASVPPGEHDVMYAYRFPYSGVEHVFAKSFPYGVNNLRVLASYEVARLSSDQLIVAEEVIIGGRPYQLLTTADLQRGTRISLVLRDLPKASFADRMGHRLSKTRLEYTAPVGLGLIMISLLGFVLWRRRIFRGVPVTKEVEMGVLDTEHDSLIQEIASLDDRFEHSSLDEVQYRRRRETLTTRLVALSRRRFVHLD